MEKSFLEKKYLDLPRSKEVESAVHRQEARTSQKVSGSPDKRVEAYLNRLSSIFKDPDPTQRQQHINVLKDKLYELFVIEPKEFPESYFDLQIRVAREQGHGDIEITPELRKQATEIIINDQKKSLDAWVDYLGSSEAPYPNWFRYFAFRNIVKLSEYDKEKKEFRKRSKGTTALFPDINREALSNVYDQLHQVHETKEKLTDPELHKLFEQANFAKLYAYAIEKATPASQEQKETTKGKWVKYDQGSDHKVLCQSLQGHGTGWCTAGEGVAQTQLEAGDFYAYYTQDKDGNNTIPRIAIRMQEGQIAEIRGINHEQNLESNMTDITQEKMKTLPGAEQYEKKTSDMKRLTALEQKYEQLQKLSKEELVFLYEIKGKIDGFGYREDPRIEELKNQRDQKQDYARIFDCLPEQVALESEEISDKTVVCAGDISSSTTASWKKMPENLKHIGGDAYFEDSQVKELGQLKSIGGGAYFGDSQVKDLGQLKSIGGYTYFKDSQIKDLGQLKSIGGYTYFKDSQIKDLGQLKNIGGSADFKDSQVKDLGQLKSIGGDAYFGDSQVKDLGQLKSIGGDVFIEKNDPLVNLLKSKEIVKGEIVEM